MLINKDILYLIIIYLDFTRAHATPPHPVYIYVTNTPTPHF